jgi:hypothetical protein
MKRGARQISGTAADLSSRPDSPDVLRLKWRFGSGELPPIPWRVLSNVAIGET